MTDSGPRPQLPGVAIVSGDRRVRDGLASLLAADGRARLLGPAIDGPAALALVRTSAPDAVLVDLTLPLVADPEGLLAELRGLAPHARLLAIAWDGEIARGVGRGVVDGYVRLDDRPAAVLDDILREVTPAH